MERYGILIAGPPGTGKSTCAATIADIVGPEHTLVLCAKPNESNSFGYRSRNLKTEIYYDPKWLPSLGKFDAMGYMQLLQRLWELQDDEQYDAVIGDPFTDMAQLAAHELLKEEEVRSPRELGDSIGFYGGYKNVLDELCKAWVALQFARRPKHVVLTVHLQPAREEGLKKKGEAVSRVHADKMAQGTMFEGMVLPAVEGSFKYSMASDFDIVLYTDVQHDALKKQTRYLVQVQPDHERHAKVRPMPALTQKFYANDLKEILK